MACPLLVQPSSGCLTHSDHDGARLLEKVTKQVLKSAGAITVVTVSMNRSHHLRRSALGVAAWPHHAEHLLIDWSSNDPVRREELPDDPRIRLLRVDGETSWNPSLAYNFGFAQASSPWLMRMDADCWPTHRLIPDELLMRGAIWVGSGVEGRYGQFLMPRSEYWRVGGFNEYMRGWGFEDKDLRFRLQIQQQKDIRELPEYGIAVIEHTNAERMGIATDSSQWLARLGLSALRASRLHNRLVAAHCPWGREVPRSRYLFAGESWRLKVGSRPVLEPALEQTLIQTRRRCFWSNLLIIPEEVVDVLPERALPADRCGSWPIRWWHRLYAETLGRLMMLPARGLGLFRGLLGSW